MKLIPMFSGSRWPSWFTLLNMFLAVSGVSFLAFVLQYVLLFDNTGCGGLTAALFILFGGISAVLFNKLASQDVQNADSRNLTTFEGEDRDRDRIDFLIDSLNDVFWSFDPDGINKNYLSRSAERMYGRPIDELVTKPFFWTQYIHPEDLNIQEDFHRSLSNNGKAECTYRIINEDKLVKWIYTRAQAIRNSSGKIIRIEGISTDVSYLKQAEEIIEQQELQINAVVENLDMAILIVNREGKILLINKEAQQLNRKNNRTVSAGMNFFDILPPHHRASRKNIFSQVFDSRSTVNHIVDCPDSEGSIHYYSVYYVPVFGPTGGVDQICIMSRDITAQNVADEKLREKTELLRAVIDNLPDYVYVKDLNLNHIINNKANIKLIGAASEEETLGKRTDRYFPNQATQKFMIDDQRIISTGIPIVNKEEEMVDIEGNKHWLLTTKVPLKNADGTVTGIVGISRDITERKQMEMSLFLSNERFKMATRVTDDAIWDWDLATNEVYFGENYKALFGHAWDKERVNVSDWARHIHKDDLGRVSKSLDQILQSPGNNKWQAVYRYRRADGTTAHVCDRAFVICDETGKPVRMVGAMQDVTVVTEHRKSLEQKVLERTKELNAALEKQKEVVEVKDRFVSMASHEFRTPLSTIQFAAGFVRKFLHKIQPADVEKKTRRD